MRVISSKKCQMAVGVKSVRDDFITVGFNPRKIRFFEGSAIGAVEKLSGWD